MTRTKDQSGVFAVFRRLGLEPLEDRCLLSGTTIDLVALRTEWRDFTFADEPNLIEITAEELSIERIKSAIEEAGRSGKDDLILIHTSSEQADLIFSDVSDTLSINVNAEDYGRITMIAKGSAPLVIDANSLNRVLTVSVGSEVQIGNFTITGGRSTTDLEGNAALCGVGGGIANAGTLRLDRVLISENQVDSGVFDDENISLNSSGGGIWNSGSLFVYRSEISGNRACSGEINKYETAAFGAGGGIFNEENASIDLENCSILNNTADYGIKYLYPDSLMLTSGVPVKVEVMGKGGGIYNLGSILLSGDSTVSGNSAWNGGAILNTGQSDLVISESVVNDNCAYENGGGIYTDIYSTLSVQRSFIQGNTAGIKGGGIASRGNLNLVGSVISGNIAGADGGGICMYGTYSSSRPVYKTNIVNSTITGNLAGGVQAGSGGGISFTGINNGKIFAELTVANSIIVRNKIHIGQDPENDLNITAEGTCSGFYSLSTFQDWTSGEGNLLYDSSIPLFLRDYNFMIKLEGDYHLVLDSASQTIDQGDNSKALVAGLRSESSDLAGNSRIRNEKIDLGAYEYQPSDFDSAFPSRLSISPGCSFRLVCEGSDANGFSYTQYLVDFEGDGIIDLAGSDVEISWNDLDRCIGGNGYFWLAAENSQGVICEAKQVAVVITPYVPTVSSKEYSFLDDQILKLTISVNRYDLQITQWTLNWGDDSEPLSFSTARNMFTVAHYYRSQAETSTFFLTLDLKDADDNVISYFLCSHTIQGTGNPSPIPDFPEPVEVRVFESESCEAQTPKREPVALDLSVLNSEAFMEVGQDSVGTKEEWNAKTSSTVPKERDQILSDPDLLFGTEYHFLIEANTVKEQKEEKDNLFDPIFEPLLEEIPDLLN